uniref:hypothetical protein n=1 Tax=Actinokineospora sp. CA-119265 TaxID=3239890 RepID=UPI003F4980AE
MTLLTIGAMAIALAGWLIWRQSAPRLVVWLALLGGLIIGAGLLGQTARRISGWIATANDKGTLALFGGVVPAVIGVLVLAELWRAGHPRKGRPHRYWHPALAFVAPLLLLAAGGIFASMIGWLDQGVQHLPAVVGNLN